MKTVRDAVIEFKGSIDNADRSSREPKFIFESTANNSTQSKGELVVDDDNYGQQVWREVCTIEVFNDYVDHLASNMGRATQSYAECRAEYIGVNCENELSEQSNPAFTQAMADAGQLPSTGMKCMYKERGGVNWCNCIIIAIHGVKIWLENLDKKSTPLNNISTLEFRPLTPPITLIDGQAYQFDNRENKEHCGIYNKGREIFSVQQGQWFDVISVANIKPLTVDVK